MDSLYKFLLKKELADIKDQIFKIYMTHGMTVNGKKNEETGNLEGLNKAEMSKNDKIVLNTLFEVNKQLNELHDNIDKREAF